MRWWAQDSGHSGFTPHPALTGHLPLQGKAFRLAASRTAGGGFRSLQGKAFGGMPLRGEGLSHSVSQPLFAAVSFLFLLPFHSLKRKGGRLSPSCFRSVTEWFFFSSSFLYIYQIRRRKPQQSFMSSSSCGISWRSTLPFTCLSRVNSPFVFFSRR